MRQICLDVETTGRSVKEGNRVIEIGCVEVVGLEKTGKTFQLYLNPERDIEKGALAVHGISREFLEDKPKFPDIADEFLAFIDGGELVIHNASFDTAFINYELELANMPKLNHPTVDTLYISRRKFPGQSASLDALCKRLSVNSEHRSLHGALLDADLLASVFIKLFKDDGIADNFADAVKNFHNRGKVGARKKYNTKNLVVKSSDAELQNHFAFLEDCGIDWGT